MESLFERPLEPREPRVEHICAICGCDICTGDKYYQTWLRDYCLCAECYEDAQERTAGEDDDD